MSDIFESISAHFNATRSIEVPEWNTTIFWKPITALDQEKVMRAVKAKGGSDTELGYRMLIEKALNASGEKMFDIGKLEFLRTQADAMVVARIVAAMTATLTVEDAAKN